MTEKTNEGYYLANIVYESEEARVAFTKTIGALPEGVRLTLLTDSRCDEVMNVVRRNVWKQDSDVEIPEGLLAQIVRQHPFEPETVWFEKFNEAVSGGSGDLKYLVNERAFDRCLDYWRDTERVEEDAAEAAA